ncbi:fimbrial biogenesis chaperone [Ramlibacter humi]|uniref:Molecular chaperone n=1 Tax=Ramlibacter humi TaxID=2530451 RepID=A0A4Z0C0U1_9BURK|nr:fimbria/pilus periplasmic chaperone [Ramlibacter humi]TFZ04148.1 molecular chaperone [Ramlibacter humi]
MKHPISRPRAAARLGRLPFAALLFAAAAVHAGSFSVVPVRIYMSPNDRAVAITITNEGDTEVALQADLYTWSQKPDGSDDLVLTEDLLVAPPILRLGPGARQVVRLARLAPADMARQSAYRMIVREVPEVTLPKAEKDILLQLPVSLAMSMPVFVTPPAARRDVQCRIARLDARSFNALCQNAGNAYAQVRAILLLRGQDELARFEGGTYLLPGARHSLSIKADRPIAAGPAVARLFFDDGQSVDQALQLP